MCLAATYSKPADAYAAKDWDALAKYTWSSVSNFITAADCPDLLEAALNNTNQTTALNVARLGGLEDAAFSEFLTRSQFYCAGCLTEGNTIIGTEVVNGKTVVGTYNEARALALLRKAASISSPLNKNVANKYGYAFRHINYKNIDLMNQFIANPYITDSDKAFALFTVGSCYKMFTPKYVLETAGEDYLKFAVAKINKQTYEFYATMKTQHLSRQFNCKYFL